MELLIKYSREIRILGKLHYLNMDLPSSWRSCLPEVRFFSQVFGLLSWINSHERRQGRLGLPLAEINYILYSTQVQDCSGRVAAAKAVYSLASQNHEVKNKYSE